LDNEAITLINKTNWVALFAMKIFEMTGCNVKAIAKDRKMAINRILLKIFESSGIQMSMPIITMTPKIMEEALQRVNAVFIKLRDREPALGRKRISAIPTPNSEINANKPKNERAAELCPTASTSNKFAAINKKVKPSIELIPVPTIR
jgi:hypothetical protein